MKTFRSITSFALLACCGSIAFGQATATLPAAKEVLAKYIEATGGEAAYKAVKSRQVSGKMMIKEAGIGGKLTSFTGADGKSYSEVVMDGIGTETQGSDGKVYWAISQFTGNRILDGAEKEMAMREADLHSPLHPEKYYTKMEVTKVEKIGDEECYRMESTDKDGKVHVTFYSTKSGLSVKTITPVTSPLGEMSIESTISDYRKVGDLMISFKSEQKLPNNMTMVMQIEDVKVNPTIDASKFELPEAVKKMAAKAGK